jgi:beta-lactamase superfamily II metal-dependent hydrolase
MVRGVNAQPPANIAHEDPASTDAPIVHLLDVGTQDYGDATLCLFGKRSVLIDGAHSANATDGNEDHPSLIAQLQGLLGATPPVTVSLLVITHAHADHTGALPKLVKQDLLRADWALLAHPDLRWGTHGDLRPDTAARLLNLALLEEPRYGATPDDVKELLADAATLEDSYRDMIRTLQARGTSIVLYNGETPTNLLKEFEDIGLQILGPSKTQIEHCSALILDRAAKLQDFAADVLPPTDTPTPDALVDAYLRTIQSLATDAVALDAFRKNQGAINDTSIVLSLATGGTRLLMTGDMQFVDEQITTDDVVRHEMNALKEKIRAAGPWDMVKLAHHGSDNGFDETFWTQLGKPKLLGICTGANSTHHPHPKTLAILQKHTHELTWARTDHNGHTTLTRTKKAWNVEPARGQLNDPQANSTDLTTRPARQRSTEATLPARPGPTLPTASSVVASPPAATATHDRVEIRTYLPLTPVRIAMTIDVTPQGATSTHEAIRPVPLVSGSRDTGPLQLGSGRALPKLLFVTQRDGLARNIGSQEADTVLRTIQASGHGLLPDTPANGGSTAAITYVRNHLNAAGPYRGVVLLGGYDLVRAQILDALPQRLRAQLRTTNDPDNFVVWSDDAYGDTNGDGIPELPVTRIPDGRTASLVFTALQAPSASPSSPRSGLRNRERPFADAIFAKLTGSGEMLSSGPTAFDIDPPYALAAERIYLMLHGSDRDATRFWGEEQGDYPVAITLDNVPTAPGMVVFTGCCWGALVGQPRANKLTPGSEPRPRIPESSIALRFLARGARAFIGCTGVHYSPDADGLGGGGPMHQAFWQAYEAGIPPAEALLRAKTEYLRDLPHGQTDRIAQAIEYKILKEYTCLGLGW